MTKRLCLTLIIAILLSITSCGINADERGQAEYNELSGAVAMICEKTGLDDTAAEGLYRLVRDSGLTGELKYITVWTDTENSEPYYRLRTSDGKREVYIIDGVVVRITDGGTVYYSSIYDSGAFSDTAPTDTALPDTSTPETETPDTASIISTEPVTTVDDPTDIESTAPSMEKDTETETAPSTETPSTETETPVTAPPDTEYVPVTSARETETEPPHTEPPVTHKYVLNTNTKKFHLPTCSSVKQIKASNREDYTGDRETVIARGYSPCKRCKP